MNKRKISLGSTIEQQDKAMKRLLARMHRPRKCSECGIYPADVPSDLCPGCFAYKEHQQ